MTRMNGDRDGDVNRYQGLENMHPVPNPGKGLGFAADLWKNSVLNGIFRG